MGDPTIIHNWQLVMFFKGKPIVLGSSMLGPSLNGQNRLLGQIHLSMVRALCFLTSHHGMAVDAATSKLQVGLVDHRRCESSLTKQVVEVRLPWSWIWFIRRGMFDTCSCKCHQSFWDMPSLMILFRWPAHPSFLIKPFYPWTSGFRYQQNLATNMSWPLSNGTWASEETHKVRPPNGS